MMHFLVIKEAAQLQRRLIYRMPSENVDQNRTTDRLPHQILSKQPPCRIYYGYSAATMFIQQPLCLFSVYSVATMVIQLPFGCLAVGMQRTCRPYNIILEFK